jgi:hypothetical protein
VWCALDKQREARELDVDLVLGFGTEAGALHSPGEYDPQLLASARRGHATCPAVQQATRVHGEQLGLSGKMRRPTDLRGSIGRMGGSLSHGPR